MTTKDANLSNLTLQASAASVKEGAVAKLTVIGEPNSVIPYVLVGIAPEDVVGGDINGRVKLDELGIGTISVAVAADNETEGGESLIVNVANKFAVMSIEDTSKAEARYFINASEGVVEEGRVATFTISATNVAPGTRIPYEISGAGITAKDVSNGKLTGSVALGSDSSAVITIPIAADKTTEGDESLSLTLMGRDATETITIDDASTEAVVAASYTVWASESAVEEGNNAEFLIETDPSEAGKSFKWSITGVSNTDVLDKKLTGTVTIQSDGTATILIPTAPDGLTEGTETLTLSVNNQKASAALLDNRSIRVSSVVLNSDSQGSWGLYRLFDGSVVVAEAGLTEGDELAEYVPLKSSPSKNFSLPKTVSGLISYVDGGFGLLSQTGVTYSEQRFSEVGIAKGGAVKLSASQLIAKEGEIGADLNGDGITGDSVVAVLDGDGDPTQEEYGLYQTLSGAVVVAEAGLGSGDELVSALVFQASKGKVQVFKPNQRVLGLAQTEAGDWEVLTQSGKALSAQAFDALTGIAKGKAVTLKPAQLETKELQYGLDITGDGQIGKGAGSPPTGSGGDTFTAGSGVTKVVKQISGSKDLSSRDLSQTTTTPSAYMALALGASGGPGTVLNIDYSKASSGLNKPLIVGATTTERNSVEGKQIDKLLSDNKGPFPGIFTGGPTNQGTVNFKDAKVFFSGGFISSYWIKQLNLNVEFLSKFVAGAMGAGFGQDARGSINIADSEIHFYRKMNSVADVTDDYDAIISLLILGSDPGATGIGAITDSLLEFKGGGNSINVGEAGGNGRLVTNKSHIDIDAQYSPNDSLSGRSDFASANINVGRERGATGFLRIMNGSLVSVAGKGAEFDVGYDNGRGEVQVDASRVQVIAKRSADPLLRKNNPLTWEEYADDWSGAYLVIGYDQDDGSAKTNTVNEGVVSIANNSLFLVRGPHAGIEVGGAGTQSSGQLTIDRSVVEVVGSGAIKKPGAKGDSVSDYLGADDGGDYFTFMNIGGSNWKDFGGAGVVNLKNGAELKLYGFDITSGDTVLEANRAYLNLGDWGTKAALTIEGGSKASVAGQVRLGIGKDMAATDFNTASGLVNVANYSMVNIDSGNLSAYNYTSSVSNQGTTSPLTNYGMYTVLGKEGSLTANQLGFYKGSQIIGSGSIVMDDVFSQATVSLHPDMDTQKTYGTKDAGSDGFMVVDEAELSVGDTFNFNNLGRQSGIGTLTIKDQTDAEHQASLRIEDSTFIFDITGSQSDRLVIEGFDYLNVDRNNYVVTGKGAVSGQKYVLIDLRLKPEAKLGGDLEQLLNLKLVGVKGELSFDQAAMDVVFTVF